MSKAASKQRGAGEVAEYLLSALQQSHGPQALQGKRPAPLPLGGEPPTLSLQIVAARRLKGVKEIASAALCAWHRHPTWAVHTQEPPSALQLLAYQARGVRVVTTPGAGVDLGRHPDGAAFVVHDLCHLMKFRQPATFHAQVGFFLHCERLVNLPAFWEWESQFDARWRSDRNYVFADMNGSPVFLAAALKMRLKMAVRRLQARREAKAAPQGPLTGSELSAYACQLDALCDLLALAGPPREAWKAVSSRRDKPQAARVLFDYFHHAGAQVCP